VIAIEVLVGLFIVTVLLVGIVKIGAPIADAFAERLRLKFQELGPEEERQLKARIEALEEEVRNLKGQVLSIQESTEFSNRIEQTGKQEPGGRIEIPDKKPDKKKV
jgi:hypothetical protein